MSLEIVGLVLTIAGVAFAFETPRRKFVGLFRRQPMPSNALLAPAFHLKQVGFSGGGHPHKVEYIFRIENRGGDCFSVSLSVEKNTIREFPKFSRGDSQQIRMRFDVAPSNLDILLRGLGADGVEHKRLFIGTKTNEGFVFQ